MNAGSAPCARKLGAPLTVGDGWHAAQQPQFQVLWAHAGPNGGQPSYGRGGNSAPTHCLTTF